MVAHPFLPPISPRLSVSEYFLFYLPSPLSICITLSPSLRLSPTFPFSYFPLLLLSPSPTFPFSYFPLLLLSPSPTFPFSYFPLLLLSPSPSCAHHILHPHTPSLRYFSLTHCSLKRKRQECPLHFFHTSSLTYEAAGVRIRLDVHFSMLIDKMIQPRNPRSTSVTRMRLYTRTLGSVTSLGMLGWREWHFWMHC